jgi:cytochrome c peroxidase
MRPIHRPLIAAVVLLGATAAVAADGHDPRLLRSIFDRAVRYSSVVEFLGLASQANFPCEPDCPLPPADPVAGRGNFGFNADQTDFDDTTALFEGPSEILGAGTIVSNGRSCATCHRPDLRDGTGRVVDAVRLGLPHHLPLSDVIPPADDLFTGRVADDGDHPDGLANLNERGLVLIRPGRFNPLREDTDPFRQLIVWRKVPRFVNTGLTIAFLNDGRMRDIQETTRGAIFTHTQNFDQRFDDLLRAVNPRFPSGPPTFEERPRNIAAFIETTTVDPPALKAFLNPADPTLNPQCSSAPGAPCTPEDCLRLIGAPTCDLYAVLVADPFFTVAVQTPAQTRGKQVFIRSCMGCHNAPNLFGNIEHVAGDPLRFPPRFGHTFDIGVSQRNRFDLDFRAFVCTDPPPAPQVPCAGTRELRTVVLPLARADGQLVEHSVTDDVGTAGATGRYEDLHRFKVPQLRRVNELAPYFHDNSAATLEEVLDYFESEWYRRSRDGRNYPIRLTPQERRDLLSFLRAL